MTATRSEIVSNGLDELRRHGPFVDVRRLIVAAKTWCFRDGKRKMFHDRGHAAAEITTAKKLPVSSPLHHRLWSPHTILYLCTAYLDRHDDHPKGLSKALSSFGVFRSFRFAVSLCK